MAVEGSFGGEDEAARDGDQAVSGAIIIRATGLEPNKIYEVTHPYGRLRVETNGRGQLPRNAKTLAEFGGEPGEFAAALDSTVFSNLLEWSAGTPDGYLGDPEVEHRVVGSPSGTNFFRIREVNDGKANALVGRTDLFSITGKILQGETTE